MQCLLISGTFGDLISVLCRRVRIHRSASTFFKQKTAYEMESRDWSSDVCSSD
eukprot:COSAG02_NODE_47428_length_341_cov_0.727273_1_plen_52_part_01